MRECSICTSHLEQKELEQMVYEIAGLKIEMHPKYGRLLRQSASYRSSGEPVMTIEPNPYDEARVVMKRPSEEEREYICCSAAFCRKVIPFGRFYLHASAVVCDGEAYLFSAPSGTGKSTHTAMWRELFPGSFILNDDKPVILPQEDQITVFGTPFAGKTNLQVNCRAPLKGICFLKRGTENQIREVPEDEALALMLNHTWRPKDTVGMNLLIDMISQVVSGVSIFEMSCTREPEAAKLSYRVMKGK